MWCSSTPLANSTLLVVDPTTNQSDMNLITGLSGWRGVTVAPTTGKLYFCPRDANTVLIVAPMIDPCVSKNCSTSCENECGWQYEQHLCRTGGTTDTREHNARLGECPTHAPTQSPTRLPSLQPSHAPTPSPSLQPFTSTPSQSPTDSPTDISIPSLSPTDSPTLQPSTSSPSGSPTPTPTLMSSTSPSSTASDTNQTSSTSSEQPTIIVVIVVVIVFTCVIFGLAVYIRRIRTREKNRLQLGVSPQFEAFEVTNKAFNPPNVSSPTTPITTTTATTVASTATPTATTSTPSTTKPTTASTIPLHDFGFNHR